MRKDIFFVLVAIFALMAESFGSAQTTSGSGNQQATATGTISGPGYYSVYDPIYHKNVPIDELTQDQIERILSTDNPTLMRWNTMQQINQLSQMRLSMKTQASEQQQQQIQRQNLSTTSAAGLTRDQIAAAFGIQTIYDPISRRNMPVDQVSKEDLIAFLNNPITQRFTFGTGSYAWINPQLKSMGLYNMYMDIYAPEKTFSGYSGFNQ